MYTDDLILIAVSSAELQALLDVTTGYVARWQHTFNATKSFVLVFGESAHSCSVLHAQHHWHISSQDFCECDDIKHLGILRSVNPSTSRNPLDL